MAIANKLETIYDSCKDIRDVITEKNSSLGKGNITTLGSDVTKICNPNSYIHKVNINPQELQHLDNENITIENYGNCGNTKTRGAIYIPLAGAYNWTATFTINDGSILQYSCGITAAAPTTGVNVISIIYTGWKTTGSGTTSYSTAANCNYLYLLATYIDGGTGIPTFEEFVSNATFSLTAYGKNGNVREDDYVGLNYTSIASAKYQNDINLSSVIIPDTVTTIGNNTFNGCFNLQYINLENVKKLNEYSFYRTTNLKIILNMPNLTGALITNQAFCGSGITEIQNLGSITKIEGRLGSDGVFTNCKNLTNVILPSTLKQIGPVVFKNCINLTSINLNYITSIYGTQAFLNCQSLVGDLSIPNLTNLSGSKAFQGCKFTSISNLGTITSTPNGDSNGGVFSMSTLESVVLPETLTTLGSETFMNCTSLNYIQFPSNITKFGAWAFRNCKLLKNFTVPSTITSIGNSCFMSISMNTLICNPIVPPSLGTQSFMYGSIGTIYVPYSEDHSILDAYKTATNWSAYASKMIELNPDGSIPT